MLSSDIPELTPSLPKSKALCDFLLAFSQYPSCTVLWSVSFPFDATLTCFFLLLWDIHMPCCSSIVSQCAFQVAFNIFSRCTTITTVHFRLFYHPPRNLRSVSDCCSLPPSPGLVSVGFVCSGHLKWMEPYNLWPSVSGSFSQHYVFRVHHIITCVSLMTFPNPCALILVKSRRSCRTGRLWSPVCAHFIGEIQAFTTQNNWFLFNVYSHFPDLTSSNQEMPCGEAHTSQFLECWRWLGCNGGCSLA